MFCSVRMKLDFTGRVAWFGPYLQHVGVAGKGPGSGKDLLGLCLPSFCVVEQQLQAALDMCLHVTPHTAKIRIPPTARNADNNMAGAVKLDSIVLVYCLPSSMGTVDMNTMSGRMLQLSMTYDQGNSCFPH